MFMFLYNCLQCERFGSRLGHFEDKFTVAIRNKVGFWLGHLKVKFTVAISNVVSSILGHVEGYSLWL